MATGRLTLKKRLRGWRPRKARSRPNTTIMYERVRDVSGKPGYATGTQPGAVGSQSNRLQ